MWIDFGFVFQWWGTLFLVGAFAYPFTRKLFPNWYDEGYLFAKAVGMAMVTWIIYAGGTLHLLPFTNASIYFSLAVVFGVGIFLSSRPLSRDPSSLNTGFRVKPGMTLVIEELFFFGALLLWSWVKAHEPSIHGLEKFMDFGFTQSILNTTFLPAGRQVFPAPDMWYAGLGINYYYFGHLVMAVLTKFSGIDLAITFNLMLATIFAFTATMSFSIGYQLVGRISSIGRIFAGLLTSFLVTMAGNMQTIYAFTSGYIGDEVKPFWHLLWPVQGFFQNLPEGINRYWYANATRFIPYTIHEFPSYSFVVSDVHGHVLSLPFVLLAIALLVQIFSQLDHRHSPEKGNLPLLTQILGSSPRMTMSLIFYGFLCGVLLMTNALDGPIYFGLFLVLFTIYHLLFTSGERDWKKFGLVVLVVGTSTALTSLPFLLHFKSFVSGIAVNCPPFFLENLKIGPILFESLEKCQHSPLWMMWLLWGFFIYCGIVLISRIMSSRPSGARGGISLNGSELLLITFFLFSLALIIFPEFFYFKDIYPMHFRSNTMFKLGYDAFILFSIVSAYVISTSFWGARRATPESKTDPGQARMTRIVFFTLLIPQLFLVSIYPIFSVRSYFGELKTYRGLDGLVWLKDAYPDDYAAIQWLNSTFYTLPSTISQNRFAILEADGDSYTDYARFSAFTGIPTIIGWPVHEWLWRGSYDVVSPRREEVRKIYESKDVEEAQEILKKYDVKYIIVGALEREKYKNLEEEKFKVFSKLVFQQGETVIYEVSSDF